MKIKKAIVGFVKAAVFLALLITVLLAVQRIVERKASRIKYEPYLASPQEYDVLFLGDSHVVNGVFPMELYHDYGIASYNLAGIGSTLPVSYWTMMQAFDQALPKLVVIGVKDVEKPYKLSGSSGDLHTALDALPLTKTKLRAIWDLTDEPYAMDDEGNLYADLRLEYVFTLGKYHARWSEIGSGDFRVEPNSQKGAQMRIAVADPNDYDLIDENQTMEESGWGFAYLRSMIEACQARGVEVMLVHLPYPSTEEEQMAANAVYYVAQDYGVNYVDLVSLDHVVDYEVDCYDSFSHLNPSGARKVTDFIGKYLTDMYDLPDRRGDAAYAHWDAQYDAYLNLKLDYVKLQDQMNNALMLLHDESFSLRLSVAQDAPLYEDEKAITLMHNMARDHLFKEDAFCRWSNAEFPLEGFDEAAAQGAPYGLVIDRAGGARREFVGEQALEGAGCPALRGNEQIRIDVVDPRTGDTALEIAF